MDHGEWETAAVQCYVLPRLALGGDKGMRWICKETVYLKIAFCHHLHTLMLFQTFMNYYPFVEREKIYFEES